MSNIFDDISLDAYLNNVKIFNKSKLSLLKNLEYENRDKFLRYTTFPSPTNNYIQDYINLYIVHDFDMIYKQTLKALEGDVKTIKDVIFKINIFEDSELKLLSKIDINRKATDVEEGIYLCPNCSSKRTISTAVQTRSLDEASTISVVCMGCNFSWNFAG